MEISMLISPTKNILVKLIQGNDYYCCELINISKKEIKLSCYDKLSSHEPVSFQSDFFRGTASVKQTIKKDGFYIYELTIIKIHYKRGIIINLVT